MDELKELMKQIGLPSVAIPVVVIGVAIIIFFLKRALKHKDEKEKQFRETMRKYANLQEKALFEAYRSLFERVSLKSMTSRQVEEVVSAADDLIMGPFDDYRAELPDEIREKFFNDIHSILAQYRSDPTAPRPLTPKAIGNLAQYGDKFLKEIESLKIMISKYT